jgi:hypothetical protein
MSNLLENVWRLALYSGLALLTSLYLMQALFGSTTLSRVHECLLHVDDFHCPHIVDNLVSNLPGFSQRAGLTLSEEEKNSVLHNYA